MPSIAIQELQHDRVEPDPHNPRQVCEEAALTELANDIAVRGILQPIVVRKHPTKVGHFMIVFGERRWRAAGMVDCDTVPAIVREYAGELQVLEDQIAENGKRADVHPLEEADAYRRLHEEHGREVDEIAELTGKSKAYVYAAMKLCALTAEPRRAFLAGKFDKSIALLIARLPSSQQATATKEILTEGEWDYGERQPMSYRMAKEYIRDEFMLRLATAPFKIDDATLDAKAGACTMCPKRTGNQRELFSDVVEDKNGGADVCTDSTCFKAKVDVHWSRIAAVAKEKGRKVIEGKAAEDAGGYGDKHVRLDDRCFEDPKQRSYRQLLGKHADDAVTAIARGAAGQVKELVPKAELPKLLKAAGVNVRPEAKRHAGPSKEDRVEAKRQSALETAVVARVHQEVLVKASAAGDTLDFWRLLARMAIRAKGGYGITTVLDQVLSRRQGTLLEVLVEGKAGDAGENADVRLCRLVDKIESIAELRALVFELMLGGVGSDVYEVEPDPHAPKKTADGYYDYLADEQGDLLDAIDVLDVDVKALTKEATKAFEAAELAKAEAKKAPKPKKQLDGELAIPHKPGCELERFVFVAAGEGVAYHPRKGSAMSTGAGGFTERKCPKCDSGVTTPVVAVKPKKNGVAPAAEATP
jgi:ParB/RepB/Spo0J family partition protein